MVDQRATHPQASLQVKSQERRKTKGLAASTSDKQPRGETPPGTETIRLVLVRLPKQGPKGKALRVYGPKGKALRA